MMKRVVVEEKEKTFTAGVEEGISECNNTIQEEGFNLLRSRQW